MRTLDHTVEQMMVRLGLGDKELAERKSYLEFTDADISVLHQIHDHVATNEGNFADPFYDHLLGFPQLRALLGDPAALSRVKHAQSDYFLSLTAGAYDEQYVRDRLRIGIVHQRIGLDPKWYIGAYRKYVADLLPAIRQLVGDDLLIPAFDALLKIVCLDMGLALDTYFEADRQEILRHRNYAEQVIQHLPAGLIAVDSDWKVRSINAAMREMLNIPLTLPAVGMPLGLLASNGLLLDKVAETWRTGADMQGVAVAIRGPRGLRHLDFTFTKSRLTDDQFLLLIAQDVTERVKARAELRESEERFRLTFNLAGIGLAHIDLDGRMVRANRKLRSILGYSEEELRQFTSRDITHPEDLASDQEFRLLQNDIQSYTCEKRCLHRDGHYVWVHVTTSLVRGSGGEPSYFILAVEDISQRKKAADQLERLAKYDTLTELPNRVLLQDRLLQAISHAKRAMTDLAVLFVDLDRFKDINDSLGHEAGDMMLEEISSRLLKQLRGSDTVARLGGDEFVILLQDVKKDEQVATVADKILAALGAPMTIKGMEFFPTASIGISIYPRDGGDSQTLLKNADTAMYQAKAGGKNNFQFYAQEMNDCILNRLNVESGLRRALERHEFALHYQPQLNARSGEIVGVEALLRWSPPGQPPIMPGSFIEIAEETGQIVPIGQWVLREACAQCRRWADSGLPKIRVTVNISARQFRQDVVGVVSEALAETGCDPGSLMLELTESALMDDPELSRQTMQRLRKMGVHLAIDDFGTGYSSLNYLRRFPIDTLKIDRSFVHDISFNDDDATIVKAVIGLARALNLSVIAEGVETMEQVDFLKAEHCDLMQGYYLAKPLPADAISVLLSASTSRKPDRHAAGDDTCVFCEKEQSCHNLS